ncbi:protein-export chaperone SecB [Cochlodiniinecator piscidefendens]|uniref:protein-export chaperone SecB n=1 Tax=Cochlodiniinecator piscidefendens TaxID=2715756 RepID=UPI00140C738E|nr:protein-export chaperone SecB [Cochlodiniinecator piscidefendens]
MAENENGAAAAQPQPVKMQILAQFIRDMSFENIVAQKGVQGDVKPDIQVKVNLDAKKRSADNQYDVITKLEITSKNKENGDPLFLLSLDYGGVFHVENVPQEQIHAYLMIECPRMLFPYLRRIVSDITRDGGFPPLNLDNIDFVALYRSEVERRLEAERANQPVS